MTQKVQKMRHRPQVFRLYGFQFYIVNSKIIVMKKMIILIAVVLAGIYTTQAQGGGGYQRRTVEERVKMVMDRLGDLKLDKDQTTKTDSVFTEYYRNRDKAM